MKYACIILAAAVCVAGGYWQRGYWALGAEVFAPLAALLAWTWGRERREEDGHGQDDGE